jgi:hypothetical protein
MTTVCFRSPCINEEWHPNKRESKWLVIIVPKARKDKRTKKS